MGDPQMGQWQKIHRLQCLRHYWRCHISPEYQESHVLHHSLDLCKNVPFRRQIVWICVRMAGSLLYTNQFSAHPVCFYIVWPVLANTWTTCVSTQIFAMNRKHKGLPFSALLALCVSHLSSSLQRTSNAELWWFLCSWPVQAVEQTVEVLVISDAVMVMEHLTQVRGCCINLWHDFWWWSIPQFLRI